MRRLLDDDILQQVAQTGLDRALIALLHIEIVRDRALLVDAPVGLSEDCARRIAVPGASSLELLERHEAGSESGQVLLPRPHRTRAPVMLDAGAGELRLPCGPCDARRVDRVLGAP